MTGPQTVSRPLQTVSRPLHVAGGAVGLEVEAAVEFAGDGAVGAGWFYGEEFGGQGDGFLRPLRVMIAAGDAWSPGVGLAMGAGQQIAGAELVEAAEADSQFERDGCWGDQAATGLGEEMTDEWSGDTAGKLLWVLVFFMAWKVAGRWI